jgi:hypothetical protein
MAPFLEHAHFDSWGWKAVAWPGNTEPFNHTGQGGAGARPGSSTRNRAKSEDFRGFESLPFRLIINDLHFHGATEMFF